MRINAIKTDTSYYLPTKSSALTSFRGDGKTTPNLPAQGQDVVQIQSKTDSAENKNSSSGSTLHNFYKGLKHFFMEEPNIDPALDNLDMLIYRSLAY